MTPSQKAQHREVLKAQRAIEKLAKRLGIEIVKRAATRFVNLERVRRSTLKKKQELEKELAKVERSLNR